MSECYLLPGPSYGLQVLVVDVPSLFLLLDADIISFYSSPCDPVCLTEGSCPLAVVVNYMMHRVTFYLERATKNCLLCLAIREQMHPSLLLVGAHPSAALRAL